jgi:hypothetical protein
MIWYLTQISDAGMAIPMPSYAHKHIQIIEEKQIIYKTTTTSKMHYYFLGG